MRIFLSRQNRGLLKGKVYPLLPEKKKSFLIGIGFQCKCRGFKFHSIDYSFTLPTSQKSGNHLEELGFKVVVGLGFRGEED